jgi:hypothetical protein
MDSHGSAPSPAEVHRHVYNRLSHINVVIMFVCPFLEEEAAISTTNTMEFNNHSIGPSL